MKQQQVADLYADYLLASFGATTATGLSQLLEGAFVRQVQAEHGVLIIDDSIEEKPYTEENDIVCWHYDHSKERMLKGINFLTALYSSQGVSLPVGFHLVAKTEKYLDPKTQKEKRRSPVSKNEACRELIKQAVPNLLPFRFVVFDVWFASAETMVFIKQQQHHDFICPLKTNRKVALSVADKHQARYTRVDTLELEADAPRRVYLEGVDFPLMLVKQVFTNEDGSLGILYRVSSATTLAVDDLTTTYHTRWQVGVSSQGSITQSVQVRPRLTDSGLVAGEAPGRESKPVKPSDSTLGKESMQRSRLQRTVNAEVASLHATPVAEPVYYVRRQQGPGEKSLPRRSSPAGYQRRHGAKGDRATGEVRGVRRRKLAAEAWPITVRGKWSGWHPDGGSGCSTGDLRAAKRAGREGPGPVGMPLAKGRQG